MAKKARKKMAVPKTAKPVAPQQAGVMAVISYDEIAKPELFKGKFTIAKTRINDDQIKAIVAPTPRQVVKSRSGKGGGSWDYIPGWWFKKKLNHVFGFDGWSVEIDGERIDGDFITVKGRLIIINTQDGKPMVTKADFGGAEIKYKKGTKQFLDLSNDFKAAQTDLIKRCCVQLGFAMDVYGKAESISAGQPVANDPDNQVVQTTAKQVSNVPVIEAECWECANPITKAEAEFSKKLYGKPFCRVCQKGKAKK